MAVIPNKASADPMVALSGLGLWVRTLSYSLRKSQSPQHGFLASAGGGLLIFYSDLLFYFYFLRFIK